LRTEGKSFFVGHPEASRLKALCEHYDGNIYNHAVIVHDFTDHQLLQAKLNGKIDEIFKFQTNMNFDKLDLAFVSMHLDEYCIDKLDECEEYIGEINCLIENFKGAQYQNEAEEIIEMLQNIRPKLSVFREPMRQHFEALKL